MNEQPFSISESLKEGWELTKANLGFLISYEIILFFFAILSHLGSERWAPWHVIGWFIVVLIKMGFYHSSLLITSNIAPNFDQLYKNWQLFVSWAIANFLFVLMVSIGLIFLIIPGFYFWARFGFFPFFILDQNVGPIEALKRASQATKGIRWPVFLLFIVCAAINILGALALGVGLLFTLPITVLALAIVYRKIAKPPLPDTV